MLGLATIGLGLVFTFTGNYTAFAVMLALAFLVMIGMVLVAEGLHFHVPKGFVYVAMAFAAAVEGLNVFARRAQGKMPGKSAGEAATPAPSPERH